MQRAEVELDFPSLPQICSLVSDVWGFITVAFYENVISYLVRAKCCSIFGIFYGDGGGRREHDHWFIKKIVWYRGAWECIDWTLIKSVLLLGEGRGASDGSEMESVVSCVGICDELVKKQRTRQALAVWDLGGAPGWGRSALSLREAGWCWGGILDCGWQCTVDLVIYQSSDLFLSWRSLQTCRLASGPKRLQMVRCIESSTW